MESGIALTIGIQNPSSADKEWNPESKTVLDSLVCYTAVFRVATQRSSPVSGEERCVATLKTAV